MPNEDQTRKPVEYICKERSLIGNEVHDAGAKVLYDGLPAENLQPTCPEGEKRYKEYLDSNAERVAKMKSQFTESAVGDPSSFMAAFAEQMKKDAAERDEKLAGMIGTAVAQAFAAAMAHAKAESAAAISPPADTTSETKAGKGKDKAGESLV